MLRETSPESMAALEDLVDRIDDVGLRNSIKREINNTIKQNKFGLIYENHLPECTPLYGIPIKKGALIAKKDVEIDEIFVVQKIENNKVTCYQKSDKNLIKIFDVNEIVTIAEFGESIYPYLKQMGDVCNAPDNQLWHTLIEADNYHALQLLQYMYVGKIDCIYIDPPYNTGAKDWKYNNDYVSDTDAYRHSKWLSMMEKRLELAKPLLNPNNSVLIVTIDEKEYLHLGCLLEQLFPEADIQMISTVTMPSGSSRDGRFGRAGEYIFYCFFGNSQVIPWKTDMLRGMPKKEKPVRWNGLIRNGEGSRRSRIPSLFYPILIDKETGKLVSIEEPIPPDMKVEDYEVPKNTIAIWPIDTSGREMMWRVYPPTLREYFKKGYAKLGKRDSKTGMRSISYLQKGMIKKIETGQIQTYGKNEEGALILEYSEGGKTTAPLTIWNMVSHSASESGSGVLKKILPGHHFPFPKSVYAVEDTLRFVIGNKPNALVLDFFAGSGTTLHAVNLINAKDGGNRRCIMVTNNEVSAEEAESLKSKGLNPGDEEWEKLGIARYITWPRTVCSIKGQNIEGKPLSGKYVDSEIEMSDGFHSNVIYFKLGFLDKNKVALGRQFKELLPMLWMKAGCVGSCPTIEKVTIPNMLILPDNKFAVLMKEADSRKFIEDISQHPEIKTVYIVTDSDIGYRAIVSKLNDSIQSFQLYKNYLENFSINKNR